jgi:urea transport system permease protein
MSFRRLFLALAALVALAAPAARADDLAAALKPLAADSYADTVAVIEKLGELGDPRGVEILRALGEGELRVDAGGRAFVLRGAALVDPLTGAAAAGVDGAALAPVRVNNRVRVALRGAVGKLGLLSPDPVQRLAAARAVFQTRSAENVALLERSLEREADPAVRAAKERALAASRLLSDSAETQLAGVHGLAASSDPESRAVLLEVAAAAATPEAVRVAARAAVESIDSRLQQLRLVQTLFQGLSLGSVLLLAALGLAITFGVMGVINMAHGEMVMLGAYATFVVQQALRAWAPGLMEASLLFAIPAAFLVAGAVGVALERGVIRFLYGRPLETLLTTWGISMILQQAVRSIFGPTNREVTPPSWMTGSVELASGVALTTNRIWIVGFGLAVLAAMALALRFTRFGLQMRAVVQNRAMARAMGVRSGRIDALTFGLGSGIAGIAGVALSQIDNVSPNLGQAYIVDSFMVVVFGGVGNLLGTLIGAMSLGVVNKLLEPWAGAVLGKILVLVAIILFIQVRPRGMFALKGRAAEG